MQDDKVSLVEMGPRDGLQNEASPLALIQRLELIQRLADSGLLRIDGRALGESEGWPPEV